MDTTLYRKAYSGRPQQGQLGRISPVPSAARGNIAKVNAPLMGITFLGSEAPLGFSAFRAGVLRHAGSGQILQDNSLFLPSLAYPTFGLLSWPFYPFDI